MSGSPGRRAAGAAAVLAVSLSMAACGINGTRGEGPVVTEDRAVGAFSRIAVEDGIVLEASAGGTSSVVLSGQRNILSLITATVDGDTLSLAASGELDPSVVVTATVATDSIDGLALSGGTRASATNLDTDMLDLDVSGASNLTAAGIARSVRLVATGAARAALEELATEALEVDLSGASNVDAQVSGSASGSASGASVLTVHGGGTVDVVTSGGAHAGSR